MTVPEDPPADIAPGAGWWTRRRVALAAAVVVLPVVAWLAFGYFGVQFLFIDDEVDQANPFETVAGGSAVVAESVATEFSGSFEDRAHPTSGTASVITDGDQRFLRFEDFATDNGPDLNVYLTRGGDVDAGFVDLGNLEGNIGDQNYVLDPALDVADFDTVVIWCVRFSVNFGEAALAAI